VGFKFSNRFKLLAFYNFYKQRYADRIDYTQNFVAPEIGLGGEAKVADKTWFFLRYYDGTQSYTTHRAGIDTSNDASYDWKRLSSGITWDSEARFEGELNIGYQWNTYENSRDRNKKPYKDSSSWVAATSINFLQTENRNFTIEFKRNFQQLSGRQNGYFTLTAAELGLRQRIRTRIVLLAGLGVGKNKYYSDYSAYHGRKDTKRSGRASLKYLLSDWLAVGIGYDYLRNDSNKTRNDYRVNRLSITFDVNPAFLHMREKDTIRTNLEGGD
jgi:hypothetical protein